MTNRIDPLELQSFADGELPEPRRSEVARLLDLDAEAARQVEDLRRLRAAAGTLLKSAPGPSEDLRRRIGALAAGTNDAPTIAAPIRARPRPRPTRIILAGGALAALLAFGAWLAMRTPTPPDPRRPDPSLIPASLVQSVTQKHLGCSAMADHFLAPEFPKIERDLAPAMSKFLGRDAAPPNLESLGFVFSGAGPCRLPGGTTLHLLYRSPDGKVAVSLFLQPDDGQLLLPQGRATVAAGPDRDHPILIWRADGLLHYLIADSFGDASRAATAMGQSF